MLRQQIFEAVEALRQRKCRPDRETIAHHIAKKHGVQFPDVFTELENIVDQGGLLKVEYKGSTSYRSPDQLDSNSSPLLTKHSKILNSSRTSRLVITAISELLNENQDWNTYGIPQKDLEAKLFSFDAERFKSELMQTILEREVSAGNILVSKKTGRMFPKDLFPKDDETVEPEKKPGTRKSKVSSATPSPSTSATSVKKEPNTPSTRSSSSQNAGDGIKEVQERVAAAVRKSGLQKTVLPQAENSPSVSPGTATDTSTASTPPPSSTRPERHSARNKRKKEVFDPSDLPPAKKASNTCKTCNKSVGKTDESLTCSNCACNYHTSCVKDLPQKKKATRRSTSLAKSNWVCSNCKGCDVCGGGGNNKIGEEELLEYICSKCYIVVILHKNCIEASEDRKCGKCLSGVLQPLIKEEKAKGNIPPVRPPPKKSAGTGNSRKKSNAKGKDTNKDDETDKMEVKAQTQTEASEQVLADRTDDEMGSNSQNGNGTSEAEGIESELVPSTTQANDEEVANVVKDEKMEADQDQSQNENVDKTNNTEVTVPNPKKEHEQEGPVDPPDPTQAANWNPKDVEAYFHSKGLAEEGTAMREQQIDGLALLLMRRSDILQGMNFLLGPGVKVYRLIVELQKTC